MTPMRRVFFSESSHNSVPNLCIAFIGRVGGPPYSDREARSKVTGCRPPDPASDRAIFRPLSRAIPDTTRSLRTRCDLSNPEKVHVMRALRLRSAARASEHPLSLRLRIQIWPEGEEPRKA